MGNPIPALIVIACFAVPAVASTEASSGTTPLAEWTILVYQDADNDLELTSMADLEEMTEVGSSASVNVIVLSDRAEQGQDDEDGYWSGDAGGLRDWRTAKLLRVERGRLRALADWGEVNMADPATLRRFLATGMRDFPARRYGLFLLDHGMAWPGICSDDSASGFDVLTLDEIAGVLGPLTRENKLELLAFDACLMGSFEAARAVAPFAKALVASEELEPAMGWDYAAILAALGRNPTQSGLELGTVIADTYMASYAQSADKSERQTSYGLTLSVVALDQIAALERSVNELGQRCSRSLREGGRRSWLRLARARTSAEEYGLDEDALESSGTGLHDLAHLASQLQQPATSPEAAAATAVIAAMRKAVVHAVRGKARPNASGLSIFFPADEATLTATEPVAYASTAFGRAGAWMPFLTQYAQAEAGDTKDPEVAPIKVSGTVVPAGGSVTFSSVLSGQDNDVERTLFFLGKHEGHTVRVLGDLASEPNAQGLLQEEWDGRWFTIGDGKRWLVCPITDFEPLEDDGEEEEETKEDAAKEALPANEKAQAAHKGGFGDQTEESVDEDDAEEEDEAPGFGSVGKGASDDDEGAGETVEGTVVNFGNQSDGDGQGAYLVSVPAQLQRSGRTRWRDVTLYFYVDFQQEDVTGEFVSAYIEGRRGVRELELRKGDRVRPVYLVQDAKGKETTWTSDDPREILLLAEGDSDLSVGYEEVDAGSYEVGFHVVDFAGNVTEETVKVEVE